MYYNHGLIPGEHITVIKPKEYIPWHPYSNPWVPINENGKFTYIKLSNLRRIKPTQHRIMKRKLSWIELFLRKVWYTLNRFRKEVHMFKNFMVSLVALSMFMAPAGASVKERAKGAVKQTVRVAKEVAKFPMDVAKKVHKEVKKAVDNLL